jgi:hypothetical protein
MSPTKDRDHAEGGSETDHGWRQPERIPPTQYTRKFLSDRQALGQVLAVDEGWTLDDLHKLPSGVRWVLYPNGDLMNVGAC